MHADTEPPTACENCGVMLQGVYCHACGQSAHNPLRNVAHAFEEVFESFWHLDGRVFRTLRDLLVPGRVACNYLAGQRVRYIPPLRLFLVLTLLTFFVGRVLFSGGGDSGAIDVGAGGDRNVGVHIDDTPGSAFAQATTEAEVVRQRDKALQGLAEGRKAVGMLPIAAQGMERAEAKLRADADLRIAQLRKAGAAPAPALNTTPAPAAKSPPIASPTAVPRAAPAPSASANADARPASADPDTDDEETSANGDRVPNIEIAIDKYLRRMDTARLRDPRVRWNAATNPADLSWLPAWGDRWLNHRLQTIASNVRHFSEDKSSFPKAFVGALPTALFLMMPVFALLLRLFYVRRGHGVLEHLVVALYSHAFLLLALIGIFVLNATGGVLVPAVSWIFYLAMSAVIVYIPVYLLLMQKRVYAQGWPKTIIKYLLIGGAYQFLLSMAALFAAMLPFLGGE